MLPTLPPGRIYTCVYSTDSTAQQTPPRHSQPPTGLSNRTEGRGGDSSPKSPLNGSYPT